MTFALQDILNGKDKCTKSKPVEDSRLPHQKEEARLCPHSLQEIYNPLRITAADVPVQN